MKIKIGLSLLAIIGIFAIFGPSMSGVSYYETDLEMKNLPPSLLHWFGTDDLGRDVFTRVWYGARISLLVGIAAALIDMVIGVLWGGLAAYFGGKTDDFMMGIADVLYALPYLLVVIVIMVAVGQGLVSILIAMTVIGWITMARIVRGKILQLKQQDFVMAAHSMGASHTRIFFGHLLPNAWEPIIVTMTATIPSAIFVEAFLSFLGLGIQAPIAQLGNNGKRRFACLEFLSMAIIIPIFVYLSYISGF